MAFEGHQNSLFHYPRQGGVNLCGVNGAGAALPFESVSCASQDQDTASFLQWPYDDRRKLTDSVDWDGEKDLQGLVSNIVDETDSQLNFYNGGSLPLCDSIWSPKTSKEEMLQHNSSFSPNNVVSHDSFRKAQQHSADANKGELTQQPSVFAPSQQWLFNLPNGDNHQHLHPQKLPPGLPIPNKGNLHLPQTQQSKFDRNHAPTTSHFYELSGILNSQNEANNSSCFNPFSEDLNVHSSNKPFSKEQHLPEDFNPLARSFLPLMPPDYSPTCLRGSSSMQKMAMGIYHEDEQWKMSSPVFSTKASPTMHNPQQLGRDFGSVLGDYNKGTRKQTVNRDAFQDLQNSSSQNAAMYRDQRRTSIMSQMQMDKRKMNMSGFIEGGFQRRPQANSHVKPGEKQIPFFDFQGAAQPQRFDGQKGLASVANMQQCLPTLYPANVLRRHSNNFSPRFSLSNGSGVPGMSLVNMPANESLPLNPYIAEMRARRGENVVQGSTPATNLVLINQKPVAHFQSYLEECYEQWRCLEEERQKTEDFLLKTFMGKKTTAAETNVIRPKPPPSQPKLDQLIMNQKREQEKVTGVLDKIECLHSVSLHGNIHSALSRHQMAICVLQARCKEDPLTRNQQQTPCHGEAKDMMLMVIALKELVAATKKLRTALWCALQTTMPKPTKTQTQEHAGEDAAVPQRCISPFEGYSFIM